MKKKSNDLKHFKIELSRVRNRKSVNPIWKLSPQQLEYIRKLGIPVTVKLYCIKTRTFYNTKGLKHILKDIHFAKQNARKNQIFRSLTVEQRQILDEYKVEYYPYKYIIHLNG